MLAEHENTGPTLKQGSEEKPSERQRKSAAGTDKWMLFDVIDDELRKEGQSHMKQKTTVAMIASP